MFKKSINLLSCIGIMLFLGAVTGFGQESVCVEARDSGGKIIPNTVICEISESDPFPLGPVRVPNNTKVVIRIINKSPFDDCTLADIKLTPIVEPDPIEKFISIFTKSAVGPLSFGLLSEKVDKKPGTLTGDLVFDSRQLAVDIGNSTENTGALLKGRYKPLIDGIKQLVAAAPRNSTDFEKANVKVGEEILSGKKLKERIEAEIKRYTTSVDDADTPLYSEFLEKFIVAKQREYDAINARIDFISKQVKSDADIKNINTALINLSEAKASLEDLRTNFEAVKTARGVFKDFIERTTGPNPFTKEFPAFLPYSQQAATTSVTCTNAFTKKVVYKDIPIAINFKRDSRITVSVGPLFSTIPKQKLGTTQINTGLNSSGAPTFTSQFAVVDRASYQIIPFAFINYRLAYLGESRKLTNPPDFSVNFSFGIGVNPNSGTNEVEYFIGPSLGYKRFFFQFGDHIGRFQRGFTGGFNIGDTVPASFPSVLPIDKEYRNRFGIAFSYRLF